MPVSCNVTWASGRIPLTSDVVYPRPLITIVDDGDVRAWAANRILHIHEISSRGFNNADLPPLCDRVGVHVDTQHLANTIMAECVSAVMPADENSELDVIANITVVLQPFNDKPKLALSVNPLNDAAQPGLTTVNFD